MKKRLSSVSYEGMRPRAVELFRLGNKRQEIMASLGIPKSTLSRWLAGTMHKIPIGTRACRRAVPKAN